MPFNFNYRLGQICSALGYKITRGWKHPESTLNLLNLGIGFLAAGNAPLTVIQIGAFDGELSDPLRSVLSRSNLTVLFVEPQKYPFETLKRTHGTRPKTYFENSAIDDHDGPAQMFMPPGADSSPKASLDKNHLLRFGLEPT